MVTGERSGAMGSSEVVSGNIEFYTLFTKIDITRTGDFSDNNMFSLAFLNANANKLSVWGYSNDYTGNAIFSVGDGIT